MVREIAKKHLYLERLCGSCERFGTEERQDLKDHTDCEFGLKCRWYV
jgi:hypothetical protein